jgi:hypothetical protein
MNYATFFSVLAIGVSPILLVVAIMVRNGGHARAVTFLPPASKGSLASLNKRIGNILLLLPVNCMGFGGAALMYPEHATVLITILLVLFLLIVFASIVVAQTFKEVTK